MKEPRCDVDCEEGRRRGCQTYCCRLLVRLDPDEREPTTDGSLEKGFVDKAEDGYCIHFDRVHFLCAIWQNRPNVCRKYDCNNDCLLQAAVREPFKNIVELAKAAVRIFVPKECYVRIPYCGEQNNDKAAGGN